MACVGGKSVGEGDLRSRKQRGFVWRIVKEIRFERRTAMRLKKNYSMQNRGLG